MLQITRPLPFNVPEKDLAAALSDLLNIDEVFVAATYAEVVPDGFRTTWSITFSSEWENPAKFEALWYQFGCMNCTSFSSFPSAKYYNITSNTTSEGSFLYNRTASSNVTIGSTRQLHVEWIQSRVGPLIEWQTLSASDKRAGNHFGWSVSTDGEQIAVGAPHSASMTTTTWDFETGNLMGWTKSGDAFDLQPTYGDNSYSRVAADVVSASAAFAAAATVTGVFALGELRSRGVSSNLNGLYYIGTFEKRPGDPLDYRLPSPDYPEGAVQGDTPTGLLLSDVFIIHGTMISFLIGGGCDIYKVTHNYFPFFGTK